MRKKLFSFVCCLAPMGAMAAAVSPEYLDPTDGTGIITQTSALTIAQDANPKVVANYVNGDGETIRTHDLIIDNAGGIDVYGLSVGDSESFGAGFLYVPNYTDASTSGGFAISSKGPVSITSLLRVLTGNSLILGGISEEGISNDVKVTVGEILNDGTLELAQVTDFISNGAINNNGDLEVNAGTVTVNGAGLENRGTLKIKSAGAMDMQGTAGHAGTITNASADTVSAKSAKSANITAASLKSGAIQNNSGTMTIDVGNGALTVVDSVDSNNATVKGVIENKSGTEMEIKAGTITVDGAMTNEGNDSTMKIIASGNLEIKGQNTEQNTNGTHIYNDASFVNGGNLYVDVAGATTLANGFDISTMDTGNTFEMATGTLNVGTTAENWTRLFNNKLNKFALVVRNGDIDTNGAAIVNGAGGNTGANMTLTAQNVKNVESIENSGNNLYIGVVSKDAQNNDVVNPIVGDIAITNGITANSGVTKIYGAGELTSSNGTVSAQSGATMHLSGESGVALNAVSNSGEMRIQSSNATDGNIKIANTVTNAGGTLDIESRDITISGVLTSNGGVTNIKGSDNGSSGGTNDSLSLAQVDVNAGVLNINALKGGVTMSGPLTVTGGAMNIGVATKQLDVTGPVNIAGDVTLSQNAASSNGDVNIGDAGVQNFTMTSTDAINITGGIDATGTDANRTATFVANSISVGDNGIKAGGQGNLKFADSINSNGDLTTTNGSLTTTGAITAATGSSIEFYKDKVTAASLGGNGKFIAHGSVISATDGDIDITNDVRFNGTDLDAGLVIKNTTDFTLTTADAGATGGDINLGGVKIANGNTLHIKSAKDVELDGIVEDDGALDINAADVTVGNNLTIGTTGELTVDAGNIYMAGLTNNGQTTLSAGTVSASAVSADAGMLTINSSDLTASSLSVANGGTAILNVNDITVNGRTSVAGNLVQGNSTGALNLTGSFVEFISRSMGVTGNFDVENNFANYDISGAFNVGEDINVSNGAGATVSAQSISAKNITNNGTLAMSAVDGIALDNGNGVIDNRGDLTLSYAGAMLNVGNFMSSGMATLNGAGLNTAGEFEQATLYQNAPMGGLNAGDVNVIGSDFAITAPNIVVDAIAQQSGKMTLNTSDLIVKKNGIDATGLRVQATPATNWLNVGVEGGDVSGNVQFIGLEHMNVAGNYTFDNNSVIDAAILPYAGGVTENSTSYNYWADVSTLGDDTFGQITNRGGDMAEPLISVGGQFITNLDIDMHNPAFVAGNPATTNQVSIRIFDMIDQGAAIWLVHADEGIKELGNKIRNLNVLFCNADGSKCFDYFGSTEKYNLADENLPAYLSVRDSAGDGKADSLYIVFDSRFGGPQAMFKIQPVVGRVPDHSKAEYTSAGALDDLIEGQLLNAQFSNRTPIDAIPVAFAGTKFETLANELYKRMEYYDVSRDGTGLARFSRLTEVREAEQLTGSVVLNEHTTFRDFEDRMLDEFIWHRNRNLRKAWGEFDFGLFNQKTSEGVDADGTRFSFTGGYDWHETPTLILGLTGHLSHMSGEGTDKMNLGYRPDEFIAGHVKTHVADTNVGLGGYLLKTLTKKMRMYGNAFLDMHWLDMSRTQTFVDKVEGNGTAFSLISEWGLMHDWLNQYVVGNLYVRGGYNTGFSINEKIRGSNYMKLESDGYFILTPGYSLIAQKRFYPSTWFQIRPYISVGAEYDVAGAPSSLKYKFAPASHYTKHDVDIDPLWMNIGGGMEFVSVMGVQVGLDYRYQYNSDIQMHKIKLSGSYRF